MGNKRNGLNHSEIGDIESKLPINRHALVCDAWG